MGKDTLISHDAIATAVQEASSQLERFFEPIIKSMLKQENSALIIPNLEPNNPKIQKIQRVIFEITPDNLFLSMHEHTEKDLMGDKRVVFDEKLIRYQTTQICNPQKIDKEALKQATEEGLEETLNKVLDQQWESPHFGQAAHLRTLNQALEILQYIYPGQEAQIISNSEIVR